MIQTFSFTSFGIVGLPSCFNKPRGDSIIHWSSRTIGWHLTYRSPGLLTEMSSPQFPEGPFEMWTSCTTLSRLPIAVELRCSTMQIFSLHFPSHSCSPTHKCGHPQPNTCKTPVIMSTLKICKSQIVPSLGSQCYLLLEGPSLFLPITLSCFCFSGWLTLSFLVHLPEALPESLPHAFLSQPGPFPNAAAENRSLPSLPSHPINPKS